MVILEKNVVIKEDFLTSPKFTENMCIFQDIGFMGTAVVFMACKQRFMRINPLPKP